MTKRLWALGLGVLFLVSTTHAKAGVTFEPYYSLRSNKSIKPGKDNTESESIRSYEDKGLRASLSFLRLFRFSLGVGQGVGTTTTTQRTLKDNYNEIDFDQELDMSTQTEGTETKMVETQNRAKVNLVFDPGFWIFIARLQAGVTAQQRLVKLYEDGSLVKNLAPPITYKPNAGVGLGVRFSSQVFFMIEYAGYFYSFPKLQPFEREASVSFGVSL